MPELPEVETVRRTLAPLLLGRRVARINLARPDIVTGPARPSDLLLNSVIAALDRKGKQLALIARARDNSAHARDEPRESRGLRPLVVHLGMTGQLIHLAPRERPAQEDHIHCTWTLVDARGAPAGTLIFRDPRRFGGLFTYPTRAALDEAWSALGPDALDPPRHDDESLARLWRSRRAIKAALLDQSCLAGVGNIYADEALFDAGIHPARRASALRPIERAKLLDAVRAVLHHSLDSGGSTLRDYRDGRGAAGSFQQRHQVYGRAGQPCIRCGGPLSSTSLAQRTTVWCPNCQPRQPKMRGTGVSTIHIQSNAIPKRDTRATGNRRS